MIEADHFPGDAVRLRARLGLAAAFPPQEGFGRAVYGGRPGARTGDPLDDVRLVPPIFSTDRLEMLIELGREPTYSDVRLESTIGGFTAPLPIFVCAFGSTELVSSGMSDTLARQAGALGLPMVIGENVVPMHDFRNPGPETLSAALNRRIAAYAEGVTDHRGGVVVQQSTEDADAEVWNAVYSDPAAQPLLDAGQLGFELKVGQGAKPGLGGMTLVDGAVARRLADRYTMQRIGTRAGAPVLRSGSPGTFTAEIFRHQIRQMHNNFPRAKLWVKLHPGRDVAEAAKIAWDAGADAVVIDGAEGGTGWAPSVSLDHVGLPLGECLRRVDGRQGCLLVSGRVWEGARAAKCLALGAAAVGLGRAALLAVDEDPDKGLSRFVECLDFELRLLISAVGKYRADALGPEDLWSGCAASG
ncbi:glutamate synthase-related protein [Micromonospora sp. NPDC049051]|uniref:glutamate synthase-related protein n=1 Tax=Micromonospora sp. NPDC049051 TaxID=3364264 RepID=UPI003724057A